jgi:flagellar L-ring protein FlgH
MWKKNRLAVLALALFALSACAGGHANRKGAEPLAAPPPAKGIQLPAESVLYSPGPGLFRENRSLGFFEDLRAHRVGDLVTINIVETSKASKKADTKTSRASSINAGINNMIGYEARMGKYLPNEFDNTVMFKASMANDFDGSGSTGRTESMTAAITARVLQVLPNGNLYIEGTRQVRVNNEIQYITLSGLIRPTDISPDNTILSSYIADAKIDYTGSGPVSDKQRPGWMARILDHVWPF